MKILMEIGMQVLNIALKFCEKLRRPSSKTPQITANLYIPKINE